MSVVTKLFSLPRKLVELDFGAFGSGFEESEPPRTGLLIVLLDDSG